MTHARPATRRWLVLACAAALGAGGLLMTMPTTSASNVRVSGARQTVAAPAHDRIVSAVPKAETPNVQDESVDAIYDAGNKIIAGGDFSRVRSVGAKADDIRPNIFAFDEETGVVDQDFAPLIDGVVNAIIGGPTPGTVYIAGRFSNVGDSSPKWPKIALLSVDDGSPVETFHPPVFNGAINDIRLVGDRLIIGGSFTAAPSLAPNGELPSGPARRGLASLNAQTGELDDYLTVELTENHSWTPDGSSVARGPIGVEKLAVSPDESHLVAIGNFKKANGAMHDQVVKIDLGRDTATVSDWDTEAYRPSCTPNKFDSYVRDVAFAPDGSYFVVVTTGAAVAGTLCDTAARWSATATGTGAQPTWVAHTGGDTLLSVAISEQAVYVGGHFRWMNNDLGKDAAKPGAVGRASIAALDPRSGLPLAWNPGRNPRGYGITEMYLTPQGLWIGHDQEWIGNKEYKHDRIAFFPLDSGTPAHSTDTRSLPGNIYAFGKNPPSPALFRVNVGGDAVVAADGGPNWQADSTATPSRYHNSGLITAAGRTWISAVHDTVSAVTPREIFNSERSTSAATPQQSWDIPIARETSISVRLYFAARCGCTAGSRKFQIDIDGVRKASNVDVTTAAGGNEVGMMRSFQLVSDGNVDIDLLRVTGDAPLNAIEIYRDPAPATVGDENRTLKRSYDGNTAVGAATDVANPSNEAWQTGRGGFMVGDTLFYALGNRLFRRTFTGSTFGDAVPANPYSDPLWDKAQTSSGPRGQTFAGVKPDFFAELPSVTGMFYDGGRLYYAVAGHPALYWRSFSPDSGTVGAVRGTVPGTTEFADAGSVFLATDRLYLVSRTTGALSRMGWADGAPTGGAMTISGPRVDGVTWWAKVMFVGP